MAADIGIASATLGPLSPISTLRPSGDIAHHWAFRWPVIDWREYLSYCRSVGLLSILLVFKRPSETGWCTGYVSDRTSVVEPRPAGTSPGHVWPRICPSVCFWAPSQLTLSTPVKTMEKKNCVCITGSCVKIKHPSSFDMSPSLCGHNGIKGEVWLEFIQYLLQCVLGFKNSDIRSHWCNLLFLFKSLNHCIEHTVALSPFCLKHFFARPDVSLILKQFSWHVSIFLIHLGVPDITKMWFMKGTVCKTKVKVKFLRLLSPLWGSLLETVHWLSWYAWGKYKVKECEVCKGHFPSTSSLPQSHRGEHWLSSIWSAGTENKKCLMSSSLWSTIQK